MKKNYIKHILSFLLTIGCLISIPKDVSASTSYNLNSSNRTFYLSNKDRGSGIFNEENQKYLSSNQKKQLKEIQNCKDTGKKLTEEQEKNLNSIVDSVIKGKLGEEKYKNFKTLAEKKRSGTKLTEEEIKNFREYKKILHGCEDCSNRVIFKQFFR